MKPTEAALADKLEALAWPIGGVVVLDNDRVVELRLREIPTDRRPRRHPIADIAVFEHLSILDVSGYPTRSSDLKTLPRLKNLKELDLSGTVFVDDEALSHIAGCHSLESLHLAGGHRVSGKRFGLLIRLRNLRTIRLDHSAINGDGIRAITSLTQLTSLGLQGHDLKDEDLKHVITKMPQLVELDLWGQDGISDKMFSRLKELRKLKILDLSVTNVSDLQSLGLISSLESLTLDGTEITDVTPLAGLTHLEELSLDNVCVDVEQVQQLQKSLPNCRIMWRPKTPKR